MKYIFTKAPSCLDAAYERKAIQQGLVTVPIFPENIWTSYEDSNKEVQEEFNFGDEAA